MFERRNIGKPWEGKIDPFRIIGNVWFVGTFQASVHLIDTGDGLILIDTGYLKSFYLVLDSIYRAGFDPKQVKYIINTHWHNDHTEASGAMANLSGAKNLIGRDDAKKAEPYFTPDILIKDGDVLSLGNTTIHFMETPGHTKGCISLFFDVEENGTTYRCGMFGGAGANTLVPKAFDFEGCREAYFASLERLKKEPVEVFLGNHTWNNDTFRKAELLKTAEKSPFIDPPLWSDFLDFCKTRAENCIKPAE